MEDLESDGLLPRFSLRWFAFYFTLSIVLAWVLRQAIVGHLWAWAVMFTASVVVGLFLIYAAIFMLVWIPSSALRMHTAGKSLDVPGPTSDTVRDNQEPLA